MVSKFALGIEQLWFLFFRIFHLLITPFQKGINREVAIGNIGNTLKNRFQIQRSTATDYFWSPTPSPPKKKGALTINYSFLSKNLRDWILVLLRCRHFCKIFLCSSYCNAQYKIFCIWFKWLGPTYQPNFTKWWYHSLPSPTAFININIWQCPTLYIWQCNVGQQFVFLNVWVLIKVKIK